MLQSETNYSFSRLKILLQHDSPIALTNHPDLTLDYDHCVNIIKFVTHESFNFQQFQYLHSYIVTLHMTR